MLNQSQSWQHEDTGYICTLPGGVKPSKRWYPITINNACLKCIWYLCAKSCLAYPKEQQRPNEIWEGYNNHRKPYPGDNGIQFEPIEDNEKKDVTKNS